MSASTGSAGLHGHISALDGLRGVAILLVLVHHAWPRLVPAGFIGVDLFFVLSGYLITQLLLQEAASERGIGLGAFYLRRAARLGPALVVAVPLAIALIAVAVPPLAAATARGAAATLTETANVYRLCGVDLGGLNHTWSLGVEEQFYLLWPLILAVTARAARRSLLGIALALTFAFAALSVALGVAHLDDAVRFGSHGPMELLAGASLAVWGRKLVPPLWSVSAAVALLLFVAVTEPSWVWVGYPVICIAAVVVVASALWSAPVARIASNRTLVRVGGISYALYLYHYPVALALSTRLGHGPLLTFATAVVAIPLAAASTHFLEMPVRRAARARLARGARDHASAGAGVPAAAPIGG